MVKIPTYNISVYRGDDFVQSFRFLEDGLPKDLSGYTWAAQLRKNEDDDNAIDFYIDDTRAADGVISIGLTPEASANVRAGVWDLQGTFGPEVKTFIRGKLTVDKDVTRA